MPIIFIMWAVPTVIVFLLVDASALTKGGPASAGLYRSMKMINEYIDHALSFERLAKEEKDPNLKAQFQKQADAYRKLTAERAAKYGLPAPSVPERR
jgi:hypothetical protein